MSATRVCSSSSRSRAFAIDAWSSFDAGTIVAHARLDPGKHYRLVIAANNLYHDYEATTRNVGLDARYHAEYHCGMIITIDRAGRVVVPKALRERFNLTAGTELEIKAVGDGLKLQRIGSETSLRRKHGILVHHGSARAALDVGEFIRGEREARIRRLTNETD